MIHPFHVSVCEIVFNPKNQSLEITHKFFVDDLEEALNAHFNRELDLLQNPEDIDAYLQPYLEAKFQLKCDNKPMELIFLGSEFEDDALRCYMEINNISNLSQAEVTNKVLLDTFEDQQNLVHVRVSGKVKSILISNSETSGRVSFQD